MTARRKKSPKKAAGKAKVRKKPARAGAGSKDEPAAGPADGGFVILLDEPEADSPEPAPPENGKRVPLRSDCTIEEVSGMRQRLLNAHGDGEALTVDLSAVDKVDTAFLQLLCSLAQKAREDGVPLHFEKHSASVRESAALLGIAGVLQCGR